jgi:GTP-binding protein HflX
VVGATYQRLRKPDPFGLVGRGKLAEVGEKARANAATLVIFDQALTPGQARNVERELALPVIDRSQLIMDIFAQRAHTLEGKLQVEIAQLSYLQPRLVRQWKHLSRQAVSGGAAARIGTRGPGETQLEVDRRRLRQRLDRLKRRLDEVQRTRSLQRSRRTELAYPTVALVGYTNSGKTTLMNRVTGACLETAARPFSTLDPTVRRLKLPGGVRAVMVDTVGFIHRLPHTLIDAFKATLEEVRGAGLLLHVVDAASPLAAEHARVVENVLAEIGAADIARLLVANKADLVEGTPPWAGDALAVSALTGRGIDALVETIGALLDGPREEVRVTLPSERNDLVAMARRDGRVLAEDYRDGVVRLSAVVSRPLAGRLRKAAAACALPR